MRQKAYLSYIFFLINSSKFENASFYFVLFSPALMEGSYPAFHAAIHDLQHPAEMPTFSYRGKQTSNYKHFRSK